MATMRALTIRQPWASFVASGVKRYETRGWSTDWRGVLAVHAGKHRNPWVAAELPHGCVIAVARLVEVHPVEALDVDEFEAALGDFSPGRYAWELADVRPITPVRARGMQGLWVWTPPANVARMLRAA